MKQLVINTGSSRALFDATLALLKEHGYYDHSGNIRPENKILVGHADGSLNSIPRARVGFQSFNAETQFGELVDLLETGDVTKLELGDCVFEVGSTATFVETPDDEAEISNAKLLELEGKLSQVWELSGFEVTVTDIKVGCQSFSIDDLGELATAIRAKDKTGVLNTAQLATYAGKLMY